MLVLRGVYFKGIAALFAVALAGCRATPPAGRTVLLVSIDTLRADHLGLYGDRRAETPAIDALGGEGLVFEAAWTTGPLTLPAHASLLSGRLPPRHGVRANGVHRLPAAVPLVSEAFSRGGFRTAAFVGGFPLAARFGLTRGFDVYDDELPSTASGFHYPERLGAVVVDRAVSWLQAQPKEASLFLFVHLYDPHADYTPPPAFAARFPDRPYDGEIAYVDSQVARLRAALEERARWEHAVVVLVSDHGEGLGEHDEDTHGMLLYESTLRVPLILRAPGLRAGRAREPVSLTDVVPTLLSQTGLPPMGALDGRDLVGTRDPRRDLYAETLAPLLDHGWSPLRALRRGERKLVDGSSPQLFDLLHDPREGQDLWPGSDGAALRATLRRYAATLGKLPHEGVALDARAREALASLGYAGGSSAVPADLDGEGRANPRERMGLPRELDAIASLADPEEARARLEVLAKRESGSNLVQRRLAAIRLRVEDYEGAARAYREAGRLGYAGDDLAAALAEACRRAGEARAARGDLAGARHWLVEADRAAPGRADVAHSRGVVEARAGRWSEALVHFERANQLDATSSAAWFSKGLLLERLGRKDAARAAYERFLSLSPSASPEHAHAREYVATRR